jgi:hypothetical protein
VPSDFVTEENKFEIVLLFIQLVLDDDSEKVTLLSIDRYIRIFL